MASQGNKKAIIYLGNVDWWYHNHGHSPVRLAKQLAKKIPVLWVNSIGYRLPIPGKTEVAWRRYGRKLKSLFQGLKQDISGVHVYTPWFIPSYSKFALKINGYLITLQIKFVSYCLKLEPSTIIVAMPTMQPILKHLKTTKILYDRCDDFSTIDQTNKADIVDYERKLLQASDLTFYMSRDLLMKDQEIVKNALFLGHGVDDTFFAVTRTQPIPEVMKNLPQPIIGFYGGLDEYRIDLALLIKLAQAMPTASLVLIGPKQMNLTRLLVVDNVYHINQLPPDKLPDYAVHFDVGIIPFLNNAFNQQANPVKLKEYLALGFPIVATKLPAFEPYAEYMYLAENHEEFIAQVKAALQEKDPAKASKRRQQVQNDRWDGLAEKVYQEIGK